MQKIMTAHTQDVQSTIQRLDQEHAKETQKLRHSLAQRRKQKQEKLHQAHTEQVPYLTLAW